MQSSYNQWKVNFAPEQQPVFRGHHSTQFLVDVKVLSLLGGTCANATGCLPLFSAVFLSSVPWHLWSSWKLSNTFSIKHFSFYITQRHILLFPTKKLELCTGETHKERFRPATFSVEHSTRKPTCMWGASCVSKGTPGPNSLRSLEKGLLGCAKAASKYSCLSSVVEAGG